MGLDRDDLGHFVLLEVVLAWLRVTAWAVFSVLVALGHVDQLLVLGKLLLEVVQLEALPGLLLAGRLTVAAFQVVCYLLGRLILARADLNLAVD